MTKTNKVLSFAGAIIATIGTVYFLSTGGDGGIFEANGSKYKPGDTLNLPVKSTYNYFDGLKGDSLNPIIIDGRKNVSSSGYDLKNCSFVKILLGRVTGSGGPAVSVHGRADHLEFIGGEIDNCEYGFWIKNEPRSFEDSIYSSTVLRYITVRNVYAHDIRQHFMYAGATEYPNKNRGVTLNGKTYYFQPSLLGDIKVMYNKIRRMGKNGPMVCLAVYGQNEIAYNDIDTCGTVMAFDQGTGISTGGYSNIWVHDNIVKHTWQPNIWAFGADSISIENNVCQFPGDIGTNKQAWPEAIRLQRDPNFTREIKFKIKGNTAASIGVYKNTSLNYLWSNKSELCGNTSSAIKVDSGIPYLTVGCTTPVPNIPPIPLPTGKQVYKTLTLYSDSTYSFK